MKISIIGSGAMGSLYGGMLSRAGHDVVLFDISREHVEAIRGSGLAIEQAGSSEVLTCRPAATTDPGDTRGSDVMIVFVKSTSTEEAARQFAPLAGTGTIALTLQNGLGNEAILRKHFGVERTAAGVTSQGATFLGPGRIRHAGKGPTHIAMADGSHRRLVAFATALVNGLRSGDQLELIEFSDQPRRFRPAPVRVRVQQVQVQRSPPGPAAE